MKKIIGLINFSADLTLFYPLFEELAADNFSLFLFSVKASDLSFFREHAWRSQRISCPPFRGLKKTNWPSKLFIPAHYLIAIYHIWKLKRLGNINSLFLFGIGPLRIFKLPARIFKIKTYFVVNPETVREKHMKNSRYLKWPNIITLDRYSHEYLKQKYTNKDIRYLPFGIKNDQLKHQETIFSQLAEANNKDQKKKFFTIGTIADLDIEQNMEVLFGAIIKCREVINNIQIIVVGEGQERKKYKWLSQKMGIETLIWFVGKNIRVKKWLDSFDVFVVRANTPKLWDINNLLNAAAAAIPIISPANSEFEKIIPTENCLWFNENDAESLAQEIIKLYKNNRLRKELGQAGRTMAINDFNLDSTVTILKSWLKENA